MSLGGRKPMKGSLGTSFIIEKIPAQKRISCSSCINYCLDGSCSIKPVVFSEVGYDMYKNCKNFQMHNSENSKNTKAKSVRSIKMNEQKLLNNIRSILSREFNYQTVSISLGISRLEALKIYEKTYPIYSLGGLTKEKIINMCNTGLDSRDISMFFNIDESRIKRVIEENKSKIKPVKIKKIVKIDPKKELSDKIKNMIESGKSLDHISNKLRISKLEAIKAYNRYYNTYKSLSKTSINALSRLGLSYKDIGDFYNISRNDIKKILGISVCQGSTNINPRKSKKSNSDAAFKVSNVTIGSQSKYSIQSKEQENTDRYLESIKKIGISPTPKNQLINKNRLAKRIEFLEKYQPNDTKELRQCYELIGKIQKKKNKSKNK